MSENKKVFLGGTCAGSTWRDELIPKLKIDSFNPVVEDWTPECMDREIHERETCDYCLYTLTPESDSVYSVAEVVDDSNKRPKKTILCVLTEYGGKTFGEHHIKALKKVGEMVLDNGGSFYTTLEGVAQHLNMPV